MGKMTTPRTQWDYRLSRLAKHLGEADEGLVQNFDFHGEVGADDEHFAHLYEHRAQRGRLVHRAARLTPQDAAYRAELAQLERHIADHEAALGQTEIPAETENVEDDVDDEENEDDVGNAVDDEENEDDVGDLGVEFAMGGSDYLFETDSDDEPELVPVKKDGGWHNPETATMNFKMGDKVVGTLSLKEATGVGVFVRQMGIEDLGALRHYGIEDGQAFLDACLREFRGAYFRAEKQDAEGI